jgi:hypothetical protein
MGRGESDFASEQQSSEIAAVQFKIATRLSKLRFIVVPGFIRSNWLSYCQLLTIPQQMEARPECPVGPQWSRPCGERPFFSPNCDTRAARPYIGYGHGTCNAKFASYGSRKAYPGLGPYISRSGVACSSSIRSRTYDASSLWLLFWTPGTSTRRSAAQQPLRTREFSDERRVGAEHLIERGLKRPRAVYSIGACGRGGSAASWGS